MSKPLEQKTAIELRRKGLSMNAIAKKLKVSKGTVSLWCSTIHLSKKQNAVLLRNKIQGGLLGREKGALMQKQKKIDNINFLTKKAFTAIGHFSKRDLLITATALFWAEGSKSEATTGFVFVNSDPKMIIFMKNFLQNILLVKKHDIVCTIQINRSHESRVGDVLSFWSTLLELPLSQFGKTYYVDVRQKKFYENHSSHYGVLRLKVKKSTSYKYYMIGLIKALKDTLPV